jgi:hypothetical protein
MDENIVFWYNHLVAAENPHRFVAITPSVGVNAVAKVTFVLAVKSPMYTSIKAGCLCK